MPLPPNGKLIVNPDSIVVEDTNLNYTVGMATLVEGYINIAIFRKDAATNLTGKGFSYKKIKDFKMSTLSISRKDTKITQRCRGL